MPSIKEIIGHIETFAPVDLQEDYDNAGLITGSHTKECTGVLFSLDCTEDVIAEAIELKCNLIIAHHPVVFKGLKRLNGNNYVERTVIKAIQNNVAIYACHTNIDNVVAGVNKKIADKLGLKNQRILAPKSGHLRKIVFFVPETHAEKVRTAVLDAGAGHIGNYDSCSFNTQGIGTFRGNDQANPFLGEPNKLSKEKEVRVESIFEKHKQGTILKALLENHPYEEVAYDIYPLLNVHPNIGSGLIGEFDAPMDEKAFLTHVKQVFNLKTLKHTHLTNKQIKKVAVCGGSGQFLLKNAINSNADSYISSDFKYHEYFDAEGKILLADIGHYESEQFTPEIFYEIIQNKFPKFAIHLSKTNTNPINYF